MEHMKFCLCLVLVCVNTQADGSCDWTVAERLNDIERRSRSDTVGEVPIGDNNITEGWYNTFMNGYQYLIPDTVDHIGQCNTYYPIYLRDPHPAINGLTETAVDAVVCTRDFFHECGVSSNIQIRKCEHIIQYRLVPTPSYSAYCMERDMLLDDSLPAPEDPSLETILVKPELRHETVTANDVEEYRPYIRFNCQFNIVDYFYSVEWYLNGNHILSHGPSQYMEDLAVDEQYFLNNNISLGFNLHCGVKASWTAQSQTTDIEFSDIFFAGIKVLTQRVDMTKYDSSFVEMQLTVPIGCQYRSDETDPDCSTSVTLDPNFLGGADACDIVTIANVKNKGIKSISKQISEDRCTESLPALQALKIGESWNETATYRFEIVTTDKTYDDGVDFNLNLAVDSNTNHTLWANYPPEVIKVLVSDTVAYKNKVCKSNVDPHYTTADGNPYDNHDVGEYLLYYNRKYGIEVQQKTIKCTQWVWYASCVCGVAVKAGKDVFMVNLCGDINYIDYPLCGEGGLLQVRKVHDRHYKVYTPIGTKIDIMMHSRYTNLISIHITMAPKDLNNVVGLCGKFDNNRGNDFYRRDGATSWNGFVDSWRLIDEENFFRTFTRTLEYWSTLNGQYCLCNSGARNIVCDSTQYLNCTLPGKEAAECSITARRKRSVHSNRDEELSRLYKRMNTERTNVKRIKRQIADIVSPEATCAETITNSLAMTTFADKAANENLTEVIKNCIFDLNQTGDAIFAESHVELANTVVTNILQLNPMFVANNTEEVKFFNKNTCPNNCTSNGQCTEDGNCICEGVYQGSDCSKDIRIPPVIEDVEGGGICDLSLGDDCARFVIRCDEILEGFFCKSVLYKMDRFGNQTETSTTVLQGEYLNLFTGICPESFGRRKRASDKEEAFADMFEISASNDGVNFGQAQTIYVYDSTCQELVTGDDNTTTVVLKPSSCFIDELCVNELESSLDDPCLICDPTNAYNWTYACTTTTEVTTPEVSSVSGTTRDDISETTIKQTTTDTTGDLTSTADSTRQDMSTQKQTSVSTQANVITTTTSTIHELTSASGTAQQDISETTAKQATSDNTGDLTSAADTTQQDISTQKQTSASTPTNVISTITSTAHELTSASGTTQEDISGSTKSKTSSSTQANDFIATTPATQELTATSDSTQENISGSTQRQTSKPVSASVVTNDMTTSTKTEQTISSGKNPTETEGSTSFSGLATERSLSSGMTMEHTSGTTVGEIQRQTPTPDSPSSEKKVSTIIGGVLGAVIFIQFVVIVLLALKIKHRQKRPHEKSSSVVDIKSAEAELPKMFARPVSPREKLQRVFDSSGEFALERGSSSISFNIDWSGKTH